MVYLKTCKKQLFSKSSPPSSCRGRPPKAWHDPRRGENFFLKSIRNWPLWTHFVRLRGPVWSNPCYHRSQHHPDQRFFLGRPSTNHHSGFIISFSTFIKQNLIKFDQKTVLAYHVSTFTKTSLITESDQTLSFLIKTWCDPNFFSSGPSLIHQISPVEDTQENPTDKIGHFGPLRVILGPKNWFYE